MGTENSLAHTKWECKYHIVFAPKYRRQVIYKDIRADVGQILGTLCRRKGVEIIEAEACPDHIHMLVRIVKSSDSKKNAVGSTGEKPVLDVDLTALG